MSQLRILDSSDSPLGTLSLDRDSHGYSYVCPKCGHSWLRMESDLQNQVSPHFHIVVRHCLDHSGGAVLQLEDIFTRKFSVSSEILRREFLLLVNLWLEDPSTAVYRLYFPSWSMS